jgi:hypothetical protein
MGRAKRMSGWLKREEILILAGGGLFSKNGFGMGYKSLIMLLKSVKFFIVYL